MTLPKISTNRNIILNISTSFVTLAEPYTPTYNYFYRHEGEENFAMIFDLRYNPDLIYDVSFYSNNMEMYYEPGVWMNGSIFYEEVIFRNFALFFYNWSK